MHESGPLDVQNGALDGITQVLFQAAIDSQTGDAFTEPSMLTEHCRQIPNTPASSAGDFSRVLFGAFSKLWAEARKQQPFEEVATFMPGFTKAVFLVFPNFLLGFADVRVPQLQTLVAVDVLPAEVGSASVLRRWFDLASEPSASGIYRLTLREDVAARLVAGPGPEEGLDVAASMCGLDQKCANKALDEFKVVLGVASTRVPLAAWDLWEQVQLVIELSRSKRETKEKKRAAKPIRALARCETCGRTALELGKSSLLKCTACNLSVNYCNSSCQRVRALPSPL